MGYSNGRLARLQQMLDEALKREDYECAADIRDAMGVHPLMDAGMLAEKEGLLFGRPAKGRVVEPGPAPMFGPGRVKKVLVEEGELDGLFDRFVKEVLERVETGAERHFPGVYGFTVKMPGKREYFWKGERIALMGVGGEKWSKG